jgi:folylpolyglutamate synthase/dihydropteroate synthase
MALEVHAASAPNYFIHDKFPLPREQIGTPWGRFSLPLPGRHSAQNLQLAIEVIEGLGLDPRPGLSKLDQLYWPGRLDLISHPQLPCPVLLSGDHNSLGIEVLCETLKHIPYQNVYFLVGIGKSKNRGAILSELLRVPRSQLALTSTPFRGSSAKDYSKWLEQGITFDLLPEQALARICTKAQAKDLIVVTGSLYLVGQIYQQALEGGWLTPKQACYFE